MLLLSNLGSGQCHTTYGYDFLIMNQLSCSVCRAMHGRNIISRDHKVHYSDMNRERKKIQTLNLDLASGKKKNTAFVHISAPETTVVYIISEQKYPYILISLLPIAERVYRDVASSQSSIFSAYLSTYLIIYLYNI